MEVIEQYQHPLHLNLFFLLLVLFHFCFQQSVFPFAVIWLLIVHLCRRNIVSMETTSNNLCHVQVGPVVNIGEPFSSPYSVLLHISAVCASHDDVIVRAKLISWDFLFSLFPNTTQMCQQAETL